MVRLVIRKDLRSVKSYKETHPRNRCTHQRLTVQLRRAQVLQILADNMT